MEFGCKLSEQILSIRTIRLSNNRAISVNATYDNTVTCYNRENVHVKQTA